LPFPSKSFWDNDQEIEEKKRLNKKDENKIEKQEKEGWIVKWEWLNDMICAPGTQEVGFDSEIDLFMISYPIFIENML
jgi:hypothetical protein